MPNRPSPRNPRSLTSRARAWKLIPTITSLLIVGCGLPSGSTETQLDGVTPDQVLAVFRDVASQEGYRFKTEPGAPGMLSTEWRESMALTYQDGKRCRAEIEAVATPDGHGTVVSLQVPVERNDELQHPLSTDKADWTADGRSIDDEMLLMVRLQMKLGLLRPE
jgi:hypothetical protein